MRRDDRVRLGQAHYLSGPNQRLNRKPSERIAGGPLPLASPAERRQATAVAFPRWQYFPANDEPPGWALQFVAVVAAAEGAISSADKNGPKSDTVLKELRTGLEALNYEVEAGKAAAGLIRRPVLFGENGVPSIRYDIDAYQPEMKIVVEVEAGRGVMSNAGFRDLLRTSLIADADYLAMMIPISYRSSGQTSAGYEPLLEFLRALHWSGRLTLPFKGILLVGY